MYTVYMNIIKYIDIYIGGLRGGGGHQNPGSPTNLFHFLHEREPYFSTFTVFQCFRQGPRYADPSESATFCEKRPMFKGRFEYKYVYIMENIGKYLFV